MKKKLIAVMLCTALAFSSLTAVGAAENTVSEAAVEEVSTEEAATEEAVAEEAAEVSENEVSENEVSENAVSEDAVDVESVVEDTTTSANSASSNAFYISAKNSKYGDEASFIMGKGTKLKFKIVDANGKKIKGADKSATYTIVGGDTTNFSVKKSTVSLSKNANAYGDENVSANNVSYATLAVTYNNVTEKFTLIAGKKITSVGFIPNSKSFKTSATVTVDVNSKVDLQKLNSLVGHTVFAAYKVQKSGFIRRYYYYSYLEEFPHSTTPNKKAVKNGTISYDNNGNALTFTPTAAGTYSFVYRTSDTGKAFTLRVKAK
ncbi:MAG: hypothetical protein K6F39_04095 [Lachnospiraceae bacterium]|nr:hypothetical protein [Lachnospiraceae bacterium]